MPFLKKTIRKTTKHNFYKTQEEKIKIPNKIRFNGFSQILKLQTVDKNKGIILTAFSNFKA